MQTLTNDDPFENESELSDEELDAHFTPNFDDDISNLLTSSCIDEEEINSFQDLQKLVLNRNDKNFAKSYGIFEKNVSMLRFTGEKNQENILKDIYDLNSKSKIGNVKIPNTNIELINYSPCPNCNELHSFLDLQNYYKKPKPNPNFQNLIEQKRNDTTISCKNCGTFFLPVLIISDGTPKNQTQFLCRIQTIDSVEKFFWKTKIPVLTKIKENRINIENKKYLRNDVNIIRLQTEPTLIMNILQYSSPIQAIDFIEGNNLKNFPLFLKKFLIIISSFSINID